MSDDIQNKWNTHYLQTSNIPSPADVLKQNQHLLPSHGKALDLACGVGANALLLASHGIRTYAWDISSVVTEQLKERAIENGVEIAVQTKDVVAQPPEPESFDIIVAHRFLERSLFPALIAALKPHGLLFYQTFIQEKVSDNGPTNPDYLLGKNELLQLCSLLKIVLYREEARIGDITKGNRDVAMLIGYKPEAP